MASVAALPPAPGSLLCKIELWRLPSGEIDARLVAMRPELVEGVSGEPHQKLRVIADWTQQAAIALVRQADRLVPPEGDEA
jgi:hypothetical protein